MTAHSLTQARLKELLHYNPDTGIFTHIKRRAGTVFGSVAGTVTYQGYIQISIHNTSYPAHRLAFLYVEGAFPPHEVDHENHIRSDNAWSNLRHATTTTNNRNKSIQSNNTSGTTGVYWCKAQCKWQVIIGVDSRHIYGGRFTDKQEAIAKRKQLEKQHKFHRNHGA